MLRALAVVTVCLRTTVRSSGATITSGRFGSTHPPYAAVSEISSSAEQFSSQRFLEHYVNMKEPVVVRGVATQWPATALWTDEHIAAEYGGYMLTMEKKHEAESGAKLKATFVDYLEKHQDTGYIVSELPGPMFKDIDVPRGLRCGPLRERLSEMNLWISNGNTSSMLHRDGFNQLNCVVHGSKLWTVIDAVHIPDIPFVWEDDSEPLYTHGGVVNFDWDNVDFAANPKLAAMPYRTAVVHEGDCIFIPGDYPHHVVSPAPSVSSSASAHSPFMPGRTADAGSSSDGACGGGGGSEKQSAASLPSPKVPETAPAMQFAAEAARNLQVSFLFSGPTAYARGTNREVPATEWRPSAEAAPGCVCSEGRATTPSSGGGNGDGISNSDSQVGGDNENGSKNQHRWPLSEHPVSWVYPGTGPSTLGSFDLHMLKEYILRSLADLKPWDEEEDEDARPTLQEKDLPEKTTVGECVDAIVLLGSKILRNNKGFAGHDLIQLAEYVELVMRDATYNVGPWHRWEAAVVEIPEEDGMYHVDTIVIPGLRAALIATLRKQASVVCTTLSESLTFAWSHSLTSDSGVGGSSDGGKASTLAPDSEHCGEISARRLLRLPPYIISRNLLALVSMFNLADSARYANYVAQTLHGTWKGVRSPDGSWAGSQPDDEHDDDKNIDGSHESDGGTKQQSEASSGSCSADRGDEGCD